MTAVVALTGATGFIGRAVLGLLLDRGYSVRALTRKTGTLARHPRLTEVCGHLENQAALNELITDADSVVHLAGAIAGRNFADFARVNVVGTGRLVHALEQRNPGARLIFISSLAAREPALSDYAASKRDAENLVATSLLDWFILRPPAVYGPKDQALAALWKMLARGWLLRAGPGQARFSLIHIDDLSRAIDHLLGLPWLGQRTRCLDDGRPDGYSWADVADIAEQVSGRRVRVVALPRWGLHLLSLASQGGSRLRRRPAILGPGKVRELTHIDWVCDSRLCDVVPDWTPRQTLRSALPELPGWRQ
ncbi:MAG: NAD-dependent epimerase/dehydratase family protein [Wenzhouxiangella sp.]|nr:MAG: NAD-dependent epimerase/dehydratase family protein [Wenzhouxiangella sp.]